MWKQTEESRNKVVSSMKAESLQKSHESWPLERRGVTLL